MEWISFFQFLFKPLEQWAIFLFRFDFIDFFILLVVILVWLIAVVVFKREKIDVGKD